LGEDGLSIPFARLSDLDSARKLLKGAIADGLLPGTLDPDDPTAAKGQAEALGVFWWSTGDFEQVLLDGGGGPLYATAIGELYGPRYFRSIASNRGVPLPADPGADVPFLRQVLLAKVSKPLLAERVAELFENQGVAVPAEIATVLEFVVELAREEARMAVTLTAGA